MEVQLNPAKEDVIIEKKKLRPCCACPETKKLRDECIMMNGEEQCMKFVLKHNDCLREHGFVVKEYI